MCGIAAIYHKNGEAASGEILKRMTDVLVHRGPDDSGFHTEANIGLGFRRLSIIDLSTGHQPIPNETESMWLIFNGEIYNYLELREALLGKGHVFRTNTDSEVVLHGYEEYGTELLTKLRGMFSFIIHDREKGCFFGARDYFGIKPMYYAETASACIFASEIKSLLEYPEIKRSISPTAFLNYLTFQYVPEPETMFEGIRKLPPASYFLADQSGIRIERYFEVQFRPDASRSLEDLASEIHSVMENSIKAHRMSDVPRGAFLSGGVDSSIICALFKQYEDIHTFSVGYNEEEYSELSVAAETAKRLGTEHHEYRITAREYWETLPKLVWHQDEPVADPSAISLYFLARMAREYITVVLSGEGADELFGGYNIYHEPISLRPFKSVPNVLKPLIHSTASLLPKGLKGRSFLMRGCTPLEKRFFGNAHIFPTREKALISDLNRGLLERYADASRVTRPFYDRCRHLDDPARMQFIDINTWLPGNILMKADKMTMANSLELRVPFLDIKVLDLVSRIPTRHKLSHGTTKYVLRQAFSEVVPKHVVDKRKLGFPVPLRQWLKREFFLPVHNLVKETATDDWINSKYLLKLLIEHQQGKHDHSRQIWTAVMFLHWKKRFIDRA
jgi:asparagine synthase (glutamine-hydrolysing)